MKQSLRNIFSAASAVFLIGLFVAAAPVGAASTDERIRALEAELQQLKSEQQKVQAEQAVMKEDALAARAKLPSFRYRAGRGLTVRGADRSWQIRFGAKFQTQLSFFPGGPESVRDDSEDGPSQGAMIFRHAETDFYYRLFGGLYEFGLTQNWAGTARSKSEIMQIRFSDWSPYYPDFRILAISPGTYSPYTRVSSTSGMSMERDPTFDGQYSTGSTKGMALQWGDVPVGPVNIDTLSLNYLSGNVQWDAKGDRDPVNNKGVILGIVVDPLAKSKNMYLKGLKMGFTWVNASDDDERGSGSGLRSRTRGRNNQVTIFQVDGRGRRNFVEPWLQWVAGPWELGYTWGRHSTAQERANTLGAGGDFSNSVATVNTFNFGVFVWGPKGFLSGSRNGGWKFTYTHNRTYFDVGSAANAADRGEATIGNEFDSMRRWHYIENIMMLRWYQARNMTYALEYQINRIDKMEGGGIAAEARQRLGVAATGGTYQIITLNALWEF